MLQVLSGLDPLFVKSTLQPFRVSAQDSQIPRRNETRSPAPACPVERIGGARISSGPDTSNLPLSGLDRADLEQLPHLVGLQRPAEQEALKRVALVGAQIIKLLLGFHAL